jgi:serine/threonine kinase 16
MLSSLLKKTTKNIIHDKFEINGGVYVEDALIGEGAYAYVYRVKDSHGKAFALKKLICQTDDQIKETKKEIKLLALIKHSNVLSLLDSSFHLNSKKQTEAFLLLPLYGKSAQDIIDQGPGYPHCAFELRSQVLKMLVQCIDAINAIHSNGYTHCDFKPANVLLDDNMNAIVTDFGSACPLTTEVTSRSQALSLQDHAASNTTASFRPPELFDTPSHCTIDGKVDVWGLGCTLFALMFSRTPFENPAEGGLSVLAVLSSTFTFPETCEWPPEYYTLIKASLRSDCSARLSIDELKILAGLLPNPDISEVTGAFGSPPVFEATPGLIVQPGPENLFANVSDISATVPGATDDNFAHFEDFGNFESNSTVFRAAEQTSSNRNNKALSSKAASNVTMSKFDEGVDGNVAKLSLEERDTSNDSGGGKDNIDDDDSDFGDFVQAEVESKPETTMPSKKNVSMSAEANIMKTTKTGPFRTKSLVKKKVCYHLKVMHVLPYICM